MKFGLLLAAALLPLLVSAQDHGATMAPRTSIEIGAGFSMGNDNQFQEFMTGGIRSDLSALHSRNRFQYGLRVEAGVNTGERQYISPGFVANYRSLGASYWYAGGFAGYYGALGYPNVIRPVDHDQYFHGYALGVQAGYVQRIYKRFSLQAELSLRSCNTRETLETLHYPEHSTSRADAFIWSQKTWNTVMYVPVTFGVRYRI